MNSNSRGLLVLDAGPADANGRILDVVAGSTLPKVVVNPLRSSWTGDKVVMLQQRAEQLADEIRDQLHDTTSVVAHCTNSALALALAAELSARSAPIGHLLLVAPVVVTVPVVRAHCSELMVGLRATPGDAQAWADVDWSSPSAAIATVGQRLRHLAMKHASQMGLVEKAAVQFVDMLGDRYEAWLGHLACQLDRTTCRLTVDADVIGDDLDRVIEVSRELGPLLVIRATAVADPLDLGSAELVAAVSSCFAPHRRSPLSGA